MVVDGFVEYRVEIADVQLGECELSLPDAHFPICRLAPAAGGMYGATLHTRNIFDGDPGVVGLAGAALDIVLARSSSLLNARVFSAQYRGEKLPLRPENQSDCARFRVSSSHVMHVDSQPIPPRAPAADELAALAHLAALPQAPDDLVLVVFRLAITQPQAVAQFILLYQCLLQLADDRQTEVDRLVMALEPEVPVFESPMRADRAETIYTHLRNELAHARPDVEVEQTLAAVERATDAFRSVVHRAVSERVIRPRLSP